MTLKDLIFYIREENSLIIWLFIILFQSCSYKQGNSGIVLSPKNMIDSVNIEIKRVSVCIGNLADNDSVPVSITFVVSVSNFTDNVLMFNSGTDYYYMGFGDKSFGEFWMIHGKDSLMLSSHLRISIIRKNEEEMFYPSISYLDFSSNRMELFNFLLNIPPNRYKEYIYDYINKSNFLYKPIFEDYQKELYKRKDLGKNIVYYRENIPIKNMMPLIISYTYNCSDYLDEEGETFYYYKDTLLVERFWSRIDEWTSNTSYRLQPWNKKMKVEKEELLPIFSLGYTIVYDK